MKILFLEHLLPLPLDSGGKIKSYHTLKALSSRHEVRLLSYVRTNEERKCMADLQSLCKSFEAVPFKHSGLSNMANALSSLVLGKSFIIRRDFCRKMHDCFQRAVDEFRPDVVHIDHLQMACFVEFDGPYKTVLDQHNVEATIIRRVSETSESVPVRLYAKLEWPKLQGFELEACRKSSLVLTVSEEDKQEFQRQEPSLLNIQSLPIGVDLDYFHIVERRIGSHDILFLGTMYWPPNIDCVQYFHRDIFPLVQRRIPDCTFTISGQRPAQSVQAMVADPAVKVTGYVDDTRDVAAQCGVFVVPLRSGSGVRVKILNAMAMGLPIVSTSIGAEGIEVVSGEHILIADTAESFADAVVAVLTNKSLADRLSQNARKLACDKYSWPIINQRLLNLYDEYLA